MYTELLIAIPLFFIIINIAIIAELVIIRRKQYNSTVKSNCDATATLQRRFTLCDNVLITPITKQPLLLNGLVPDYDTADDIISDLECLYTVKTKQINSKLGKVYNYSHLKDWLAYHIVKYPGGKIPQLSGSILYVDDKAQYTMNFYDATSDKNEKYIKSAIKLLKFKKLKIKQLDILKEANKIVKSKGKRSTVKKTTKRTKKVLQAVK